MQKIENIFNSLAVVIHKNQRNAVGNSEGVVTPVLNRCCSTGVPRNPPGVSHSLVATGAAL